MNNPMSQKENIIEIEREGIYIKAKFDDKDVLEKALIIDEKWDIKIKILRYLDEVTVAIKWRDFSVKLTQGFGIYLPGFMYKSVFMDLVQSPLIALKGLLSMVEELVEKKYWIVQEIYEENYNQ